MITIQMDHKTIRELMAKDEEFAIEVKRSILVSALKHETSILMQNHEKEFCKKIVAETIKTYGKDLPFFKFEPSQAMKNKIASMVDAELDAMTIKVISEKMKAFLPKLEKRVEEAHARIEAMIEGRVTVEIERSIQAEVVRRVQGVIDGLSNK